MKVRSLLLGSVAAAGLATGGAYAADLGVLTSLDVCDNLGLSGLTISSDTNCLQITGEVKYKLTWGDYDNTGVGINVPDGDVSWDVFDDGSNDWQSRFDAWIKFVATSDSDFGPAKAVLKLKEVGDSITEDEGGSSDGSSTDGVVVDEAYVAIGEGTVIAAGKKGSIFNDGDDAPLSWLGLFNSSSVDVGVGDSVDIETGGHVIQITSDLGNGFSIGAALEDLNNDDGQDGTFVGVIAYSGDGISAHGSFKANGILAGEVYDWAAHAGFTGTFDNFKVVAAAAFDSDDYWNVLAGASIALDMFTLAGDVEAADGDYVGAGASITAAVTDGVTVNLGGRWNSYGGDDAYQVAAGVTAALSETLKMTGEVGYVSEETGTDSDFFYGSAKLDWAPGGGTFTSSLKGTVFSEGGYKIESEFKKTFQ